MSAPLGPRGAVWGAAGLLAAGVLLGAVHRSFGAGRGQAALKGLGIALVAAAVVHPPARRVGAGGCLGSFTWDVALRREGAAPVAFDKALAEARAAHRPVMIDFFAEWCAACKELDRDTYPAPEVVAEAARFVRIKADGTNATDPMDALYQRFGVNGLPTVAFVSSDGTILEDSARARLPRLGQICRGDAQGSLDQEGWPLVQGGAGRIHSHLRPHGDASEWPHRSPHPRGSSSSRPSAPGRSATPAGC